VRDTYMSQQGFRRHSLTGSFFASPQLLELLATGRNLKALGFDGKAKLVADFVLEFVDLFALKFNDALTVLADDVIMIGMVSVIGIVEFIVLPKIHFLDQATFRE
jgi:hypothetical protein